MDQGENTAAQTVAFQNATCHVGGESCQNQTGANLILLECEYFRISAERQRVLAG